MFEIDSVTFNHKVNEKTTATLALALTRTINNKLQKIIVLGDADVLSNKEISRSNLSNQENFNFATSIFKWFSNDEYPINTIRPEPIDNNMKIDSIQLNWFKITFIGLIPIILALISTVLLIKRKRQ